MSETKMTGALEQGVTGNASVQSLEVSSWGQENVEEKVRGKLIEFAAELQRIKRLREAN